MFSAHETLTRDGKPAVRLVYQVSDKAYEVLLSTQVTLRAAEGRYPFAYQFLEPTQQRRFPLVRIWAAPGASVSLERWPRHWIGSGGSPALEVIRVQDPAVIPAMATDLSTLQVCGTEKINPPPQESGPLALQNPRPVNYFIVKRHPYETIIHHPYTGTTLRLHVTPWTLRANDPVDASQRFAYEIDPGGELGSVVRPLLKIVMTPSVTLHSHQSLVRRATDPPDTQRLLGFFSAYTVEHIRQVPSQGTPLQPIPVEPMLSSMVPGQQRQSRGWYPVTYIPRDLQWQEHLVRGIFDVAVSFIPIVGDLVDIGEFLYGLLMGEDRWGRKLTADDLVVMGVGAILPFASATGLLAIRRIAKFEGQIEAVEAVAQRLQRATPTPEERQVVERLDQAVKSGHHIDPGDARQLEGLLRRSVVDPLSLEMLLNPDASGFTHPEVQAAFRRYKANRGPAGATEWAKRWARGDGLTIIQNLLGHNFRDQARSAGRAILYNLSAVPRPRALSGRRLEALLGILRRHPTKLFERLDNLVADLRSGRQADLKSLNEGLFRILKGNIAEILSLDYQFKTLRHIQRVKHRARLISGVKIRLMTPQGLGAPLLFSDNIIAILGRDRLHLEAVFEVKSGYLGGREAQQQIFRWIEGLIEDGSEIILPPGTRVIEGPGAETVLNSEHRFVYRPFDPDVQVPRVDPEATRLLSSQRHVITPRGTSHLGIRSSAQVAPQVTRVELLPNNLGNESISSAELDYLVAVVASSLEFLRDLF